MCAFGGRAKRWFGDQVRLGATYNHSDDSGFESDLYEMDLTVQYAAGRYVKDEIARSEGVGVETFSSLDGGFTYNAADRGGLANAYVYWRERQEETVDRLHNALIRHMLTYMTEDQMYGS